MFGFGQIVGDVVGTTVEATGVAANAVARLTVNAVLEPFQTLADAKYFFEGLPEGQIRVDAAFRFAGRYVENMAIEEVMNLYIESLD